MIYNSKVPWGNIRKEDLVTISRASLFGLAGLLLTFITPFGKIIDYLIISIFTIIGVFWKSKAKKEKP